MKQKFTYLFLLIMLCHVQVLIAQNAYRSVTSGNWGDASTWETETSPGVWVPAVGAPSAADGVITIQNAHTVTVAAVAGADQLVIASGGILTVSATFTVSDGTGTDLDVQSGGTINSGATFNVAGAVTNAGTINVTASTLTKTGASTDPLTNSGTIDIASGATFQATGAGASVIFNTGSVVTGSGTLRINGAPTNGTTVNMALSLPSTLTYESGGQINTTGTGSLTINGILNWTSNAIRVPLTIATGATLNSTGTGNRTLSAALINNGTVNWNASGDLVLNNTTVTNNGTFTWNATTTQQLRQFAATTAFINAGTFSKTDNSTTLEIVTVPFTNNNGATLSGVGSITLVTGGTLTNNGIVTPGTGAGGVNTLTVPPSAVSSSSTIRIDVLNGANPVAGTGHDRLILSGAVNTDLTGVTLTVTDNLTVAPLGTYTIMTTSGTFSNTFGTVNIPSNYGNLTINANTVTIDKLVVLPLTWGTFTAKAVEQRAQLTWKTLQEINTSHFVIERSSDGTNYKAIGQVPAQGNSSNTTTYTFTDPSPVKSSFNFYRLLQVDRDGKSERSIVRTLKLDRTKLASLIIQGNPVKDNLLKLNVTADDALSITISDMSGRVMKAQLLQPGIHIMPISELNAGTYQITVMEGGKIADIKRFVKL